ncbi:hypothetical protein Tco_0998403, partial [Tanacetum coccineum]
ALGSLVANVGFGITDEVSSALKDMVLLASTYSQELIRVCSHINRILDYMEGIGTENMRKARLASLGLQKTISELRSITTPVKTQKENGLKLAFVLDTEFAPATFGPYERWLQFKDGKLTKAYDLPARQVVEVLNNEGKIVAYAKTHFNPLRRCDTSNESYSKANDIASQKAMRSFAHLRLTPILKEASIEFFTLT